MRQSFTRWFMEPLLEPVWFKKKNIHITNRDKNLITHNSSKTDEINSGQLWTFCIVIINLNCEYYN